MKLNIFELRNFSLNSYVYNVTRGLIASTRAFNLLTRAFNLATRTFSLLTRGFELVTRGFELVTRYSCFTFQLIKFPFNYCLVHTVKFPFSNCKCSNFFVVSLTKPLALTYWK